MATVPYLSVTLGRTPQWHTGFLAVDRFGYEGEAKRSRAGNHQQCWCRLERLHTGHNDYTKTKALPVQCITMPGDIRLAAYVRLSTDAIEPVQAPILLNVLLGDQPRSTALRICARSRIMRACSGSAAPIV